MNRCKTFGGGAWVAGLLITATLTLADGPATQRAGEATGGAGGGAAGEPVRFDTVARQKPAQHFFVARVNLADPRVRVVVAPGGPDPDGPGPWETVLTPTSGIAKAQNLDLAVNTVFFSHQTPDGDAKKYAAGECASALNWVVIDGRPATTNRSGAVLWFDRQNRAAIGVLPKTDALPDSVWQAAAGSVQIVTRGRSTADANPAVHPRTAAGLLPDGTLILFVADGRRPGWATGLTLRELADEMLGLGCVDAINFDGGGSSTMVAKSADGKFKVLNTPCDGSTFIIPLSIERPVPYVLGVRVDPAK